ncbi:MAG: L-threonylcarbamoyladenylate synthase [Patescibacteria group bacterium]|nr:L-threonylcarbamoyladenylate synthase [Patescibacteria group bacterium]MDD4611309.1 L-threonylcarbamoyladenylate synthase [Patescibacteria group bacterium]
MKIIKLNLQKINKNQINFMVDYFIHGKIAVYPTDTIYGVGCATTKKKAIKKILKLKKRDKNKGLIILVDSIVMAKKYCLIDNERAEILKKVWSGRRPTTVILKSKKILPRELQGKTGDLAVRLPKSKFLTKIIRMVDIPLVSTSLNLSGEQPLGDVKNIDKIFNAKLIDLVIDAGTIRNNKPSKIVDLRDVKNIKVIRK